MQPPLFKITFDFLNMNEILFGIKILSRRPTDHGIEVRDDYERSIDPTFNEISIGLFFVTIKLHIVIIRY